MNTQELSLAIERYRPRLRNLGYDVYENDGRIVFECYSEENKAIGDRIVYLIDKDDPDEKYKYKYNIVIILTSKIQLVDLPSLFQDNIIKYSTEVKAARNGH